MQLPSEAPLMTLPNAILFPDAMLPLYIFEPRYRKMLSDALHSNRMFTVALQKPGRRRETPCAVAGLGLIRASVAGRDGSSHLILQGLARVELKETVRYRPYRVQRIRALETTRADSVVVDALAAKVVELVAQRLEQGSGLVRPVISKLEPPGTESSSSPVFTMQQVIEHLMKFDNADRLADLVSCTLLTRTLQRQVILESANLEDRLKHLVHFLLDDIRRHGKKTKK